MFLAASGSSLLMVTHKHHTKRHLWEDLPGACSQTIVDHFQITAPITVRSPHTTWGEIQLLQTSKILRLTYDLHSLPIMCSPARAIARLGQNTVDGSRIIQIFMRVLRSIPATSTHHWPDSYITTQLISTFLTLLLLSSLV